MSEAAGLVGVSSKISNLVKARCLDTVQFDVNLLGVDGGVKFTLSNKDSLETVVFDCVYKE